MRGLEELRHCTAVRTCSQRFVQVKREDFYCCICDKNHSSVQQAWRLDFNFGLALHLKKLKLTDIELKMIPAWFVSKFVCFW